MRRVRQLEKSGFEVRQLDHGYHFRVNGSFDFNTNIHGRPFYWRDLLTGESGKVPERDLPKFIEKHFSENNTRQTTRESFISTLIGIGWTQQEAEKEWQTRQERENVHEEKENQANKEGSAEANKEGSAEAN